jgi:RNA polymerase sigma-70 factor, ECF subfamily
MALRKLRSPGLRPSPSDWSERQLLRQVLRGEERAWAELLRRYRPLIYRCVAKTCPPSVASVDLDEIYAEVLMNLLRDDMRKLRAFDFSRGTKLGSWIGMISVHTACDHLRSAGRRPLLDRVDGAPDRRDRERSPLDLLIEKERWAHLNDLIADFSERDRTFLSLYFAEGLDPLKISERMAISLKTVYTKKHKIREHLRRRLADMVDSPIADLAPAGP